MRQLIVQEWLSLDRFATDKDNKLTSFANTVRDIYEDEYYAMFLKSIDCILFGRNTYTQFSAVWPSRNADKVSEMINRTEKIVFSKSISNAPWGEWKPAVIETGDIQSKIKNLKRQPGQNMVMWGSLSLAQLAIQARLVDQYHLHICPVITGGGRSFLREGFVQSLKLLNVKESKHGVVSLHYAS